MSGEQDILDHGPALPDLGDTPSDPNARIFLPNLFIIGAVKCGTTSLHNWLGEHPQVFMSPVKEPNFFAPDLQVDAHNRALRYGSDFEKYLELFSEAGDAQRIGESSVRYLASREAPHLIQTVQPHPWIVVSLRNPVDMMHSLYLHRRARGNEDQATFEDALAADQNGRVSPRAGANTRPLIAYIDLATYSEQLRLWFEVFGRERVHVIIFEDLVADPRAVYRGLLEFLDIDQGFQPETFRAHNPAHAGRGKLLRRLSASRIPQALVWGPLSATVGETRTRTITNRFRHSRLLRRQIARPVLSPTVRASLEHQLQADVVKTSELVGRDLRRRWFDTDAPRQFEAQDRLVD